MVKFLKRFFSTRYTYTPKQADPGSGQIQSLSRRPRSASGPEVQNRWSYPPQSAKSIPQEEVRGIQQNQEKFQESSNKSVVFQKLAQKESARSKEVNMAQEPGPSATRKTRSKGLPVPPEPERPVTLAIVGGGSRGSGYAAFSKYFPKWLKVVGVAEPHEFKRTSLAKEYGIPEENVFEDWTEMAKRPKFADAVAICTQDQGHRDPAVAFAGLKYNILCEKPMAISLSDCDDICRAVQENGVIFAVCHVLRYTPYTRELIKLLDQQVIGDIINVQHLEPVGFWHFAHSFVRGNWHNEGSSTFSLMSKSCHDLDYIPYIIGARCKKISSFGSLTHFKNENKPKEAEAAKNCFECPYERECPYSAKKIYTESFVNKTPGTAHFIKIAQPNGPIDIENLSQALITGNYGKCVYEMDNDVCDHQVVILEFEGGITATFTMVAFTEAICERKTKIFGSRGEIEGDGVSRIKVYDFSTKSTKVIEAKVPDNQPDCGHFGGDFALLQDFLHAVSTGNQEYIISGPRETLDSHIYVFAAEHSRRSGQTVDIEEFKQEFCK